MPIQAYNLSHLRYATSMVSPDTLYFNQVGEWHSKYETITLQLQDIPSLVRARAERRQEPHPQDGRITLEDSAPTIRLSNACEATANHLYGAAEIAASFANKASGGAQA